MIRAASGRVIPFSRSGEKWRGNFIAQGDKKTELSERQTPGRHSTRAISNRAR